MDEKMIVAAFDIGTTFSGYGFSFIKTPKDIFINKSWSHELGLGFPSYKTPTCILTDGNGEFLKMGYEAEIAYSDYCSIRDENDDSDSDDEAQQQTKPQLDETEKRHLFRNFKMCLHNEKEVNQATTIDSVDGKQFLAIKIFAYAIKFLKDHMLGAIKEQTGSCPKGTDVLWVITVPAIWSEQSKKFMREAAKQAGCIENSSAKNIILALEPEAASLCCRRKEVASYEGEELISIPAGTKYLIIDCGGGTVDITAHETKANGRVAELLHASGGALGATYVDRNFAELLSKIFGHDLIENIKMNHAYSWYTLLTTFESAKKKYANEANSRIGISLPYKIIQQIESSFEGQSMKKILKAHCNKDVTFSNGIFLIKGDTASKLFNQVIDEITNQIKDMLSQGSLQGCTLIFLVGGFSECKMLQNEMKRAFESSTLRILIPYEAQLAVIRGAILFALHPDEIESRVAAKTYGVKISKPFLTGVHDENRKWVTCDGKTMCKDIFKPIVLKDTLITQDEEYSHVSFPESTSDQIIEKEIYSMSGLPIKPVQYVDDGNCEHIGNLLIEIPPCDRLSDNKIEFILKFGGTELEAKCKHVPSGKEVSVSFELAKDQ